MSIHYQHLQLIMLKMDALRQRVPALTAPEAFLQWDPEETRCWIGEDDEGNMLFHVDYVTFTFDLDGAGSLTHSFASREDKTPVWALKHDLIPRRIRNPDVCVLMRELRNALQKKKALTEKTLALLP